MKLIDNELIDKIVSIPYIHRWQLSLSCISPLTLFNHQSKDKETSLKPKSSSAESLFFFCWVCWCVAGATSVFILIFSHYPGWYRHKQPASFCTYASDFLSFSLSACCHLLLNEIPPERASQSTLCCHPARLSCDFSCSEEPFMVVLSATLHPSKKQLVLTETWVQMY